MESPLGTVCFVVSVFLVCAAIFAVDWLRHRGNNSPGMTLFTATTISGFALVAYAGLQGWFGEWAILYTVLGFVAVFVVAFILLVVFSAVYLRWKHRHLLAAQRLAAQGQVEQAIAYVQQQIEAGKSAPMLWVLQSTFYLESDRPQEALRVIERGEKRHGDRSEILFNKATILSKLGRTEEALFLVQSALVGRPHDLLLTSRYAVLLAELGRFAEAHEQLDRAEEMFKTPKAVIVETINYRELLDKARQKVKELQAEIKKKD